MLQKEQGVTPRPCRNLHVGLATSPPPILATQKLRYRGYAE